MASVHAVSRIAVPVFAAAAFLAAPLGLIAPLGEAPLVAIAGVLLAAAYLLERRLPTVPIGLGITFGCLIALALLSCLWTIDIGLTRDRALRLIPEVLLGFVLLSAARELDGTGRARVGIALAAGMLLSGAMIAFDFATGHAVLLPLIHPKSPVLNHIDRGATTLVILLWPAILLLVGSGRRRLALLTALVAVVTVLAMKSDTSKLALVIASAIVVVMWWQPRIVGMMLRIAVPLLVVAIPIFALTLPPPEQLMAGQGAIKNSALHRLIIWQFTGQRIADRPLLGWGMETSRDLPGGKTHYDFTDGAGNTIELASISLHPHNAVLQVWVELGLAGAVIAASFLAIAAATPMRLSRKQGALAAGGLVTALLIALLSFGIWQSWWDAQLWLLAALIAAAAAPLPRRQ